MDPAGSVLSLVDAFAADVDDLDAGEEVTAPLHGLQEYFDKQFLEVQQIVTQTLSTRFEKASDLLTRRVRILRSMTKQNLKLQDENKRLHQELNSLRSMIQGATNIGSPPPEPEKPGGGARRNSFKRPGTPPDGTIAGHPGAGPRRNSLGHRPRRNSLGHRRSQTPTAETVDGPSKSQSAVFGAKGSPKGSMPILPVLPGHVTSNGGPFTEDVNDMLAALSTATSTKSPPAPDSPSPKAPALANAAVLSDHEHRSSNRTSEGAYADLIPRAPATNNFVKSECGTKELSKDSSPKLDGQLLVTDLLSQLSSDGTTSRETEKPTSCSQGNPDSPKYASEGVRGTCSPVDPQWRRFSSEGRAGVEAELLKRSSIDKDILLRHSLTSEDQNAELKRSDSAPLEDIPPPSGFNSPNGENEQRSSILRSRTASILKPPGAKRGTAVKTLTIQVEEYVGGGAQDGRSDASFSSSTSSDEAEKVASTTSSVSGDQDFHVLQIWNTKSMLQPSCQQFKQDLRRRQSLRKMSRLMFDSAQMGELLKQHDENSLFRMLIPFLIHPNSLRRGAWDLFSFFLLIYDIFTIPFELFDPPHTSFSDFMIWTARIFWSFDMWLSCVTGYIASDGSIILRPRAILTRYAKSWLILDAVLVGLDWMELFWIGSTSVGFARLGKASRAFRILRMLRMLRVIRLNQVIQLIDERIRSDRLMIFADIVKIFLTIMGCAHFSACVWYGIGDGDEARTWVRVHLDSHHGLAYRYFLSMHWSLSQFAGGMDEVVPHNLTERVYAVGIWITAFMMAAVLTSSLTSEITRLQIISNQHAQQLSILRRFLSDNGVSNKLSVRVQRNARHVLQQQQRYMREDSVELLWLVSEPLRMELHFEIYSPLMCRHPFFNEYIEECSYVMRKVCHSCAMITPVFVGDVIFNAGEAPRPPKMYFVVSGMQEYFTIGGNQVSVREGMWLAEATLWTNWIHRGGLRVKMDSQLCQFSAETFQEIVADSDFSLFDPRRYAEHFVKLLNTYQGGVSDLPFPRDILEEACGQRRQYQSAQEEKNNKTELLSKEEVMSMARTTHSPVN